MPMLDYFEIRDERAIFISPLYTLSLREYVFDGVMHPNDKTCVSVLLCGLSAIYSFASKSYCHADIKLNNIMMETAYKFIFIDFDSATKYGTLITSTTAGISMTMQEPSIGYDVSRYQYLVIYLFTFIVIMTNTTNSLANVIGKIMFKQHIDFITKEQLLRDAVQMQWLILKK